MLSITIGTTQGSIYFQWCQEQTMGLLWEIMKKGAGGVFQADAWHITPEPGKTCFICKVFHLFSFKFIIMIVTHAQYRSRKWVYFWLNCMTCITGSEIGLAGCKFAGNTSGIDHLLREGYSLDHVSLCAPGGFWKVNLIHFSSWELLYSFCPARHMSPGNVSRMRSHTYG